MSRLRQVSVLKKVNVVRYELGPLRLSRAAVGAALLVLVQACGVPNSHINLEKNINGIMSRYAAFPQTSSESPGKLPWAAAQFCLQRAQHNAQSSVFSSTWDVILLIAASATGGVGTAAYAASVGIDGEERRKTWAQVGSINIAATAALLGLRTALDLGSLAQEQRATSADQVEAAIGIIELLALDPEDSKADPLQLCTAGERRIAQILARKEAVEAIKESIREAKAEADAAQSKKKQAEQVEEAAVARMKAAPSPTDEAALKQQIAEARVVQAEADVAIAEGGVAQARQLVLAAAAQLRRAILFFTEAEVDAALDALQAARADVQAAKAEVAKAKKELDAARAAATLGPS